MQERHVITLLAFGLLIAGCSESAAQDHHGTRNSPPGASATIVGDVYLVMQSGQITRGAARDVYLLSSPDSIVARLTENCETYRRHNTPLANARRAAQSIAEIRAMEDAATVIRHRTFERITRILDEGRVQSTGTRLNANYRFNNVQPGQYIVYANMPVGPNRYYWLVPVTVGREETLTLDLYNENYDNWFVHCNNR